MSSLFGPIELATRAKGQHFVPKTDPNIDLIARRAVYMAMGQGKESIEHQLAQHTDVSGVVVGDEARLRQIVNNLAG
jgi:osomolarity two-component system, sensor histidine kinase SLN1